MSNIDEIKKLHELFSDGILTQEEFDYQKENLLNSISQEVSTKDPIINGTNIVYPILSDKWAWTLACIPFVVGILLDIIGMISQIQGGWIDTIVYFAINSAFVIADNNELKKSGFDSSKWIWTGIVIVPVYMFLRASKTNKKYGYAICWCCSSVMYIIVASMLMSSSTY